MKHIAKFLAVALMILATTSCKKEQQAPEENATATDTVTKVEKRRIISLNGALTEIISALGNQDQIVAVDVTSTYPEGIKDSAKDLGHVRSISIEALMAEKPELILATSEDLSPELTEKIKLAKVDVRVFDRDYTAEGTKMLIGQVATVLQSEGAQKLQDKIDADLKGVEQLKIQPKVLFIYARGAGTLMVGGKNTPVDKVIELAGGKNAVTDFEDYKPLTPEALIQANPDVILMFDSGIQSLGGEQGVLKIQGIEKTNAGKNKKIIAMDGALLSGFGPRLGEAAATLNGKFKENAK